MSELMVPYSSKADTLEHIHTVQVMMNKVIQDLIRRAEEHDASKLESPEVELFDEYTPKLATMEYNSPEYKESLEALKPALEHHYAVNRHHPQHFPGGVKDMNLVDLIEMLCDWKASSQRQPGGNLLKSIEMNRERFEYGRELNAIFVNTADFFED